MFVQESACQIVCSVFPGRRIRARVSILSLLTGRSICVSGNIFVAFYVFVKIEVVKNYNLKLSFFSKNFYDDCVGWMNNSKSRARMKWKTDFAMSSKWIITWIYGYPFPRSNNFIWTEISAQHREISLQQQIKISISIWEYWFFSPSSSWISGTRQRQFHHGSRPCGWGKWWMLR